MSIRPILIILWSLVLIAMLGMAWLYWRPAAQQPCPGSVVLPGGESLGGDFNAIRGDGTALTQSDFETGLHLLYFGYTFCPDICPIDTVRNAEITDLLDEANIELTPYFITVDPQRDTPQIMQEFAEYTHDRMVGVSGNVDQIKNLMRLYKVYGQAQPADQDGDYLVDHTGFSYLIDDGKFITAYSRSQSASEIAANIQCRVENE